MRVPAAILTSWHVVCAGPLLLFTALLFNAGGIRVSASDVASFIVL